MNGISQSGSHKRLALGGGKSWESSKMNLYETAIGMCKSCIHKKVCRFEVTTGEKCNDYIKEKWFGGEISI